MTNGIFVEEVLRTLIAVGIVAGIAFLRILFKTLTELRLYRYYEIERVKEWVEKTLEKSPHTEETPATEARSTISATNETKITPLQEGSMSRKLKKLTKVMSKLKEEDPSLLDKTNKDSKELAETLNEEIESKARGDQALELFYRPVVYVREDSNTVWSYYQEAQYPLGCLNWLCAALWRSIFYKRAE